MGMTPKSGFFLLCSCVSGIAAVGSVFELSSGVPQYGTMVTSTILAISIPFGIIAFYTAVQAAREEQ